MAENDINTLRSNLPEVFEDRCPKIEEWGDLVFLDIASPAQPGNFYRGSVPDGEVADFDDGAIGSGLSNEELRSGLLDTTERLVGRLGGGYPGLYL